MCHAKDSRNFDQKSDEKVSFGSVRPTFNDQDHPELALVYIDQLSLSNIFRSILTKRFIALILFRQLSPICREFGIGMKNSKSHSCWLARFDWKMLILFSLCKIRHLSLNSRFGIMESTLDFSYLIYCGIWIFSNYPGEQRLLQTTGGFQKSWVFDKIGIPLYF